MGIKEVRKDRTPKGPMIITIVIVEGPQYHVRNLTITSYEHSSEKLIRQFLKMKEGSVYSPKQLHDDAKAVADAYGSGGYVDLYYTRRHAGRASAHRCALYHRRGLPLVCDRVDIQGNMRTKQGHPSRSARRSGRRFQYCSCRHNEEASGEPGPLREVETYPEDTDIPGRKHFTILVQEKRTGSLSFRGGLDGR